MSAALPRAGGGVCGKRSVEHSIAPRTLSAARTHTIPAHHSVILGLPTDTVSSAKGLAESAANLEKATGSKCLAAAADVRKPAELKAAVDATIAKFGRIDFVVCGKYEWGRPSRRTVQQRPRLLEVL